MGNALDAWLPPRRYRVVINVYTLEGTGFFGAAELAFGGKVYHSGIEIDGAIYSLSCLECKALERACVHGGTR